jgi:hypothetical protein
MNCFYCDKIVATDPAYVTTAAAFDLGSDAPRCGRHWRYVCGQCGKPAHFMAVAFCPETGKRFCARCATARREVENRRYQSDEPMLALLGEVRGLRVLNAGSGNGYLCRKMARASRTGVARSVLVHLPVEKAMTEFEKGFANTMGSDPVAPGRG